MVWLADNHFCFLSCLFSVRTHQEQAPSTMIPPAAHVTKETRHFLVSLPTSHLQFTPNPVLEQDPSGETDELVIPALNRPSEEKSLKKRQRDKEGCERRLQVGDVARRRFQPTDRTLAETTMSLTAASLTLKQFKGLLEVNDHVTLSTNYLTSPVNDMRCCDEG